MLLLRDLLRLLRLLEGTFLQMSSQCVAAVDVRSTDSGVEPDVPADSATPVASGVEGNPATVGAEVTPANAPSAGSAAATDPAEGAFAGVTSAPTVAGFPSTPEATGVAESAGTSGSTPESVERTSTAATHWLDIWRKVPSRSRSSRNRSRRRSIRRSY